MSRENVEIVRRWIDAFNRGGAEAALGFADPEIEWTTTGLFLEAGTYRGHDGVLRYLGDLADEFDGGIQTEPDDLIDAGDQVVVPLRVMGRGRRSGVPVDYRMTMVVSLRSGTIVRVRNYPEKDEALKAAGLRE